MRSRGSLDLLFGFKDGVINRCGNLLKPVEFGKQALQQVVWGDCKLLDERLHCVGWLRLITFPFFDSGSSRIKKPLDENLPVDSGSILAGLDMQDNIGCSSLYVGVRHPALEVYPSPVAVEPGTPRRAGGLSARADRNDAGIVLIG